MPDNYVGFELPYDKTPKPEDMTWHRIHDLIKGWAWLRNKDVIYDYDLEERKIKNWTNLTTDEQNALYAQIYEQRQKELEERRAYFKKNPIKMPETIPMLNIDKKFPTTDISTIFR